MARPGPAPNPRGRLKIRMQLKCTDEYDRWVRGLADSEGIEVAELIAAALAEFAGRRALPGPPPRT